MTTIKFERVLRDSPANQQRVAAGDKKGLTYDFRVMIDGEHRATMSRNSYSVGYRFVDADHRPIRDPSKKIGWRDNTMEVDKQADFEQVVADRLADGLIPTLEQMAAARAERARKAAENEAAEKEAHRIAVIESAGVDLYEALKPLAVYLSDNGGDAEFHDADGTGWLTRALAALCKAEGLS